MLRQPVLMLLLMSKHNVFSKKMSAFNRVSRVSVIYYFVQATRYNIFAERSMIDKETRDEQFNKKKILKLIYLYIFLSYICLQTLLRENVVVLP